MSATDELRKLLEERGVIWENVDNNGEVSDYYTEWYSDDGEIRMTAKEYSWSCGSLTVTAMSELNPCQAAAMIDIRGKCKIVRGVCSGCGALIHESANMYWQYFDGGFRTVMHKPVNFCPNCGREVEI